MAVQGRSLLKDQTIFRYWSTNIDITDIIDIIIKAVWSYYNTKFVSRTAVIRPPVYGSNGRSYKMLVMFLFFFRRQISELPGPIAAKLCHMIGTGVYFIN